MSDILIHGMEMPEHCGECKLKAEYDDETFCPFFADNVGYWIVAGHRHEDCPLGYVQPHGDLIDKDVLAGHIEYERYHHAHNDGLAARHHVAEYGHFLKAISEAPTIIPASE